MKVGDLNLPNAVFLSSETTVRDAIRMFQDTGFAQFPVRDASGKITGALLKTETMKQLVKQRVTDTDPISKLV